MKALILLILIPLASFSQEMPVAWYDGGSWVVSAQVKDQLELALDSASSGYSAKDSWVYQDTLIGLKFSNGDTIFTDYMIGRVDHDTIYTKPAMYTCGVTCKNYNECTGGGCYKTSSCRCSCTGSGGCTEQWIGVFGEAPIGRVLRERILISNGHYIPEE